MSGRIFIRDLKLQVSIGIHDFERKAAQTVVVNADLILLDAGKAHDDRIANVLDHPLRKAPRLHEQLPR